MRGFTVYTMHPNSVVTHTVAKLVNCYNLFHLSLSKEYPFLSLLSVYNQEYILLIQPTRYFEFGVPLHFIHIVARVYKNVTD